MKAFFFFFCHRNVFIEGDRGHAEFGDKGVKPPEAFGERPRDWSLGHAGDEGPHLSMTGESRGCSEGEWFT